MLQDTAHVESDIFHKSLVVEQGATFDGEAHRTDKAEAADLAKLQAASAEMNAAAAKTAAA
jgi:cytoskeletal protein CcmA (bactofilin family)